jgi:hypothetical protein
MEADTALKVLVIILSIVLSISLLISIVAGVLLIKLVKMLKQIASKGEQFVDSAEETVVTFRQNIGAAGLVRSLTQLVKFVNKVNKRR